MSANDTSGIPAWDFFTRAAEAMRQTPFGAAMNSGVAGTGMPGAGAPWSMMTDMLAPLTNIDDLDRRINEIRAVEQWLKLNLGMVQSTAQALEVQRATLATLKAFGSMASGGPAGGFGIGAGTAAGPGAGFTPPGFPFGVPTGGGPGPTANTAARSDSAGRPEAGTTSGTTGGGTTGASNPFTGAGASHAAAGMPDMSAATEGAAAWWRMLNEQFSQIASAASAGLAPGAQTSASSGEGAGPATAAPAAGDAAENDDQGAAARRRRKP